MSSHVGVYRPAGSPPRSGCSLCGWLCRLSAAPGENRLQRCSGTEAPHSAASATVACDASRPFAAPSASCVLVTLLYATLCQLRVAAERASSRSTFRSCPSRESRWRFRTPFREPYNRTAHRPACASPVPSARFWSCCT